MDFLDFLNGATFPGLRLFYAMYDNKKILISLSGGINSMAVLCWFYEQGFAPQELHLYYAHLREHSPDTFAFVKAGIRFAREKFPDVRVRVTRNSALDYFRVIKMIPHPKFSPCSDALKIAPMDLYAWDNGVQIDLIGFVRTEGRRVKASKKHSPPSLFMQKNFPIHVFTDEWCFDIVEKYIGWYPHIYHIKDANGKRVFAHNNCLPCKNMRNADFENVQKYYPEYMRRAVELANEIGSYWGREPGAYCDACEF